MDTSEALDKLRDIAAADPAARKALLVAAADPKYPLREFCKVAGDLGCPMNEMDLAFAGEEAYAAIRRSTNGGGENSPLLEGGDDDYSIFLAELKAMQ